MKSQRQFYQSFHIKKLKNIFYSENEIFNIPFTVESFFSEDKNNFFSLINLNLMKLKIENQLSFKNEKKIGKSEFVSNNLKRVAEYLEEWDMNQTI